MAGRSRVRGLVAAADKVRIYSYSPYSKVKIGAAVLASDGSVHVGTNVENSSYGLSSCAERNAIFSAVSSGRRNLVAIAVFGDSEEFTRPCGACRQVMVEFNPRMRVHRRGADGFSEDTTASALLPSRFSLEGTSAS
jgi:cytidine deaminase